MLLGLGAGGRASCDLGAEEVARGDVDEAELDEDSFLSVFLSGRGGFEVVFFFVVDSFQVVAISSNSLSTLPSNFLPSRRSSGTASPCRLQEARDHHAQRGAVRPPDGGNSGGGGDLRHRRKRRRADGAARTAL